jgi:RNA polymerase sigma-70 factor (ECF subfamily)
VTEEALDSSTTLEELARRALERAPSPANGPGRALTWSSWLRAPEPAADPCEAIREEVAASFLAHRHEINRYLVHTHCRDVEAEEITQDAFMRLYRARLEGKVVESPRSWLFAVARNIAIDRRRRRRQERLLVDEGADAAIDCVASDTPSGEDTLLAEDRRHALADALGELTSLQRECLHLRAHGLPLREIGAIVGVPVWGVSDAVRRAIRRIQKELDGRA